VSHTEVFLIYINIELVYVVIVYILARFKSEHAFPKLKHELGMQPGDRLRIQFLKLILKMAFCSLVVVVDDIFTFLKVFLAYFSLTLTLQVKARIIALQFKST
jgi:hypothetical protein